MSLDVEEDAELALDYLIDERATIPNFRCASKQYDLEKALGFPGEGLPRYLVYDRDGKQVANTNEYEKAVAVYEALLK